MSELNIVPLGMNSYVQFSRDIYGFPRSEVFHKHNDRYMCCGETPPIYDIPVDWIQARKEGPYKVRVWFGEKQGGLIVTRVGTLKECLVEWGPASRCLTVN